MNFRVLKKKIRDLRIRTQIARSVARVNRTDYRRELSKRIRVLKKKIRDWRVKNQIATTIAEVNKEVNYKKELSRLESLIDKLFVGVVATSSVLAILFIWNKFTEYYFYKFNFPKYEVYKEIVLNNKATELICQNYSEKEKTNFLNSADEILQVWLTKQKDIRRSLEVVEFCEEKGYFKKYCDSIFPQEIAEGIVGVECGGKNFKKKIKGKDTLLVYDAKSPTGCKGIFQINERNGRIFKEKLNFLEDPRKYPEPSFKIAKELWEDAFKAWNRNYEFMTEEHYMGRKKLRKAINMYIKKHGTYPDNLMKIKADEEISDKVFSGVYKLGKAYLEKICLMEGLYQLKKEGYDPFDTLSVYDKFLKEKQEEVIKSLIGNQGLNFLKKLEECLLIHSRSGKE